MNKHILFAIAVAVLLIAGAFYSYYGPQEVEQVVYTWELRQLAEDETGMPRTEVTLNAGRRSYSLGTFSGSCSQIEGTAWNLQQGERTGVICWWAGGGEEIGVFEENGSHYVRKGQLDEGSAESPGFRGNYQTLIEL